MKPVNAPPTWAKKAVLEGLKIDISVTAENKSKAIIPGIKYLALIGTGKNIIINLLSGNAIANPAIIPISAPEAPAKVP